MTGPTPEPEGTERAGRRQYDDREAQLGGADAVEKTTYIVGEGTEPEARPSARYGARDAAANGSNVLVWAIVGIAVLIGLVYAIGIFW